MRRPTPSMAVAITALVAAFGGVAVASPLGGDGKVHLCYSQQSLDNPASSEGDLVVATNAGTACPDDYPDELVFSQAGPQGKPGPQGPAGATGASGPQGAPGATKPLLDKEKGKAAVKQLEKVDAIADRNKDKLEAIAAKLREARDQTRDADALRLFQQQQRMAEVLRQITEAMNRLAETNRKVVRDLD